MHFQLLAQLAEKLREVVGERIVVVEKQNHWPRFASVLTASATNSRPRHEGPKGKYKGSWRARQINTPVRAKCWGPLVLRRARISSAFRKRSHRACPARASGLACPFAPSARQSPACELPYK